MADLNRANEKLQAAMDILFGSMVEGYGIRAGSGKRYEYQIWTRDAALALIPAMRAIHSNCLAETSVSSLEAQKYLLEISGCHIGELTARQGPNGAIPILFSDNFSMLVLGKLCSKGRWDGKSLSVGNSFVLSRIFDGIFGDIKDFPEFEDFPSDSERGLYRLTPGTTDSELLYAFLVLSQVYNGHRDDSVIRAIKYLEKNYVRNGLHHGADWRDTMEEFFRDKPLLTNNALLYAVYKMMGYVELAASLKAVIEQTLWTGETYLDYPGATRFDPLGGSLAVLHGLVPEERYGSILAGFKSVDTEYGVTIECKHNPYREGEAEVIERTQGVVVWPFVVGFTVLAALEMGEKEFALKQFEKLHSLEGFAEWYDPATGKAWGEPEQGWSAAMYIRAKDALIRAGLLALK